MNKRLLFGIIGGGIAIVSVVHMLTKYFGKGKVDNKNKKTYDEDSRDFSSVEIAASDADSIEKSRTQSASSIYKRHQEAAELIRDIMENSNEIIEVPSEHKDEFDSMLNELDIISEER